MLTRLEELTERYTSVIAEYHDAHVEWCVSLDPQRRLANDCRWSGWGETLDEAITAAIADSGILGT